MYTESDEVIITLEAATSSGNKCTLVLSQTEDTPWHKQMETFICFLKAQGYAVDLDLLEYKGKSMTTHLYGF